jgi:hypothetical protein
MKKSKKFILAILVLLIAAIAVILTNPDWFDSGEEIIPEIEATETQLELEDEIFRLSLSSKNKGKYFELILNYKV